MKNIKGITLIALVITIIVLLILAGISISMLSGDNSILSKSTEAKNQTNEKSLKEETQIVVSGRLVEKKTTGTNAKTLEEELEEKISSAEITGASGESEVCYVKKGDTELTVYDSGEIEDGKYEIWDGSTVECPEFKNENNVWNWYIYKPSQLKFLADFVNNGNTLNTELSAKVTNAGYETSNVTITENITIYLMNNLDLGAKPGKGTTEEQKWETTDNEERKWLPIGIDNSTKKFVGIFEGNNFCIKGVYVNREEKFNGIFGNSNTIQNLTIKDSYIKGKNCSAGIVGALRAGKVENCHNVNTTVILIAGENNSVGGIVGQSNAQVNECTNTGNIIGYGYRQGIGTSCGGIVGYALETVTLNNCRNDGTIIGEEDVGGIVGRSEISSIINNCENRGRIEGNRCAGGIGGLIGVSVTVNECENSGNIKTNGEEVGWIGGIIGAICWESTISKCKNTGYIESEAEYVGGITGLVSTNGDDPSSTRTAIVEKCYNNGKIRGKDNVGGIVGSSAQYGTIIEKCYNLEEVEGTDSQIGGIVGASGRSSKIYHCYNMKKVKGISNVGGIAGRSYYSPGEIKNCYNIGETIGNTNVGGILGQSNNSNSTDTTIVNSYYLTGTATLDIGNRTSTNLAKDKTFITSTFLTNANNEETIWSANNSKNDGWPTLVEE